MGYLLEAVLRAAMKAVLEVSRGWNEATACADSDGGDCSASSLTRSSCYLSLFLSVAQAECITETAGAQISRVFKTMEKSRSNYCDRDHYIITSPLLSSFYFRVIFQGGSDDDDKVGCPPSPPTCLRLL